MHRVKARRVTPVSTFPSTLMEMLSSPPLWVLAPPLLPNSSPERLFCQARVEFPPGLRGRGRQLSQTLFNCPPPLSCYPPLHPPILVPASNIHSADLSLDDWALPPPSPHIGRVPKKKQEPKFVKFGPVPLDLTPLPTSWRQILI